MPLANPHSNFFSSLKQVEKRLKSEFPPQVSTHCTTTQSLSSPIYLYCDDEQPNTTSTRQDSETPQAFLSNSPDFPPPHQDLPPLNGRHHPEPANFEVEDDEVDEIQQLIQLLGLSEWIQEEQRSGGLGLRSGGGGGGGGGGSCCCEGGFYSRIAGIKGPKCGKEEERLEGWIKHWYNGGQDIEEQRREPLRLAHLLLGKAVFDSENRGGGGEGGGFWDLEFPSTIEEFLHNDPPAQSQHPSIV